VNRGAYLLWLGTLGRLTRGLRGALLALACLAATSAALGQQAVPELSAHVIDTTRTLNPQDLARLETKLTDFEVQRGAQIVVLMVPTTLPEDIASYANRVANTWKIGRKEVGDGLLLIVALNDRQVRIEVSKTLEGALPDLAAKRIIDEAITPRFKQADYAGGLDAGTSRLQSLISGENLPSPSARTSARALDVDWGHLMLALFLVIPMMGTLARRLLGRPLGLLLTGAAVGTVAFFITSSLLLAVLAGLAGLFISLFSGLGGLGRGMVHRSNGWGTGTRGTWGGGGGFGSGGGGDFGGGGASGRW
jgi:uncharacterized protein